MDLTLKFLIDAQLPPALAALLHRKGYDVLHALQLPGGSATPDAEIIRVAAAQNRVVLTKDSDLFEGYFKSPDAFQLVWLRYGNSSNAELLAWIEHHWDKILINLGSATLMSLEGDRLEIYF